jgi:hypothetical protein
MVLRVMELGGWTAIEEISLSLSFPCFRDSIIFTTSALEVVYDRPPVVGL